MTVKHSPEVRSSITAAREAMTRFVACIFDPTDVIEVRRLPSGKSSWHLASKLVETTQLLLNDNQQGLNIHVGANPRCAPGRTRSKDVTCARLSFRGF